MVFLIRKGLSAKKYSVVGTDDVTSSRAIHRTGRLWFSSQNEKSLVLNLRWLHTVITYSVARYVMGAAFASSMHADKQ